MLPKISLVFKNLTLSLTLCAAGVLVIVAVLLGMPPLSQKANSVNSSAGSSIKNQAASRADSLSTLAFNNSPNQGSGQSKVHASQASNPGSSDNQSVQQAASASQTISSPTYTNPSPSVAPSANTPPVVEPDIRYPIDPKPCMINPILGSGIKSCILCETANLGADSFPCGTCGGPKGAAIMCVAPEQNLPL